jgi:hypothetical protein
MALSLSRAYCRVHLAIKTDLLYGVGQHCVHVNSQNFLVILYELGFGYACALVRYAHPFINRQLNAPPPAHRSFADPCGEINDK